MEPYETLYADFLKNYVTGVVSGVEVGELVAKLAGYYPNYNMAMVKAERAYAIVSKDFASQTDETTGKSMSSAKAEVLAAASTDAFRYKECRAHVQNLEMLIQSAKSLQKGLLQEMVNSSM